MPYASNDAMRGAPTAHENPIGRREEVAHRVAWAAVKNRYR
jgi:cation transport regulator ChaB